MKKLPFICLILALCLVFAMPTAAGASGGASATAGDSLIFLTNPVAIAAIDNYVFIADNLEDNHSVVFCFDVEGDSPIKIAEMEYNKHIVNVAELNGKLAVIFDDEIVVYPLSTILPTENDNGGATVAIVSEDDEGEETGTGEDGETPPEGGEGGEGSEGEQPDPDDGTEQPGGEEGGDTPTPPEEGGETPTPEQPDEGDNEIVTYTVSGAIDVAYGTLRSNFGDGSTLDTVTYIGADKAQYLAKDQTQWMDVTLQISNGKSVIYFGEYFYYVFNGGVQYYNGPTNGEIATDVTPKGILIVNVGGADKFALFNSNNVYAVTDNGSNYTTAAILADGSSVDGNILDVCFAEGKLFVLNSNHKVEIFTANTDNATFVKTEVTIGTETIGFETPTAFTRYIKAKSLGYPTNIIYKTNDPETSIENIVPDCKDEFTILDFEGAEELGYYYVKFGNKFGWVRKSVGATTPESDAKIQIVNNNVGSGGVTYTSYFTSLDRVYIYTLPVSDDKYLKQPPVKQTIDNPIKFTFLQQFEEVKDDGTTTLWYYIEYGEDEYGFIMDGTFGTIVNKTELDEGVRCKDKKINSSLFEAVKLYLTSDMTAGQVISDANGDVVKLYSGTYVNAIETKDGATYIQVRYQGKWVYGWMPTNNIIDTNRLTTNDIVGISLLAAAIVLGVTLVAVFVHRRKHKEGKSRNQSADSIEE